MATTRYAQNIAIEQIPFGNLPGGGITTQGSGTFPAKLNAAMFELAEVKQVTAVYQMYGNEVANDVINIYMAQPGTVINPAYSSVSGSGVATTATLNIGDDDTTGYGVVSSGVAFGASTLTVTPSGASATRYASGINVATGQTNPVSFGGSGTAMTDPYIIGATASETNTYGGTVSGSWVQATFATLGTPVAGKVLVFRLWVAKP